MTALLLFMAAVVAAIIQAVFPRLDWLGQANAPVLLGLVLYYALAHSRGVMLMAAIFAGFLQDALGMIPLGYSSFCFCAVALVVSKFKDMVFMHEWLTHMLFGAIASGVVTLALYGLLAKDALVTLTAGWTVLKVSGAMLLGAGIAPFEFELIAGLDRMLGNTEERIS
jgi:rod shape-determining protein MreD